MTSEVYPAVTRVLIILDKPADWQSWLFLRKESAQQNELWDYVNPEASSEGLPKIDDNKPREPRVQDFKDIALRISDLDADDRTTFRWEYDHWERQMLDYKKKTKALNTFNSEISRTIAKRHLYLIEELDTPHERLTALKRHLAPTDATRERELADKYNALKRAPKAAKAVDQWLADWVNIGAQAKKMNLPEVRAPRAQEDFLIACKSLDGEYATTCLRELFQHEQRGTLEQLPSVESYVAEWTKYLRRVKPVSSGLTTAATTLEAARPNSNSRKSKTNHNCPCGLPRRWSTCYYLNASIRPNGWKEKTETRTKIDEYLADKQWLKEKIQAAIDQSVKEKCRSQKPERINIDNGQPPSDTNTFAIGFISGIEEAYDYELTGAPGGPQFERKKCEVTPVEQREVTKLMPIAIDNHFEVSDSLVVAVTDDEDEPKESLLTRWIVDPGSNTHVINSESWKGWTRQRGNPDCKTITAGKSRIIITAWGEVELVARTPLGLQILVLTHVAYVEGFLTSVLGLARCRSERIHFDSGRDMLYREQPSDVVAQLEYTGGHWLIDADPTRRPPLGELQAFGTSYRPSYAAKPTRTIEYQEAHSMWGHPSREAIKHLESNVKGLLLTGKIPEHQCQICVETKFTQINSRRRPENVAERPFYRIGVDIIFIIPKGFNCWNDDRYAFHCIDEYSKWHEVGTHAHRTKAVLSNWLSRVLNTIQRTWDCDVAFIRSDNEKGFGDFLTDTCPNVGITYEPSAPDTPAQNGLAERAGGRLTLRARAMLLHAKLPKGLTNEMYRTAAYVLNRTPTKSLGWKTPYEIVWGHKPMVSHMRPIGCRAYVLNRSLKKADKLESRTLIGHLVGYRGTNQFRTWLPTTDNVIITRDAVFEPTLFFDGYEGYAKASVLAEVVEILAEDEKPEDTYCDISKLLTNKQRRQQLDDASQISPVNEGSDVGGEQCKLTSTQSQQQVSTPKPHMPNTPPEIQSSAPPGYRAYGEKAPRDINLDPEDPDNVIEGRTRSKGKGRATNIFDAQSYAAQIGPEPILEYLNVFAGELTVGVTTVEIPRIHQSQLPPPPRNMQSLDRHSFGAQFRGAAHREWCGLRSKGVFSKTNKTKNTADAEVLPLMWVFTYKIDDDGYLAQFKARLVVRGDLENDPEETYAATLAIRNFRALVAVANYFNLELQQYDIPTAFLNAELCRKLYVEALHELVDHEGELMEVHRASTNTLVSRFQKRIDQNWYDRS